MAEAAFCPNCNKPAVRQGKVIVCEHCDAEFRFTREGPKLSEIGPLENRIKALEDKIGISSRALEKPVNPAPDEVQGEETDPDESEEDDL